MKKYVAVICCLLCVATGMIGCTKKEGNDNKDVGVKNEMTLAENQFIAEVLEVSDEYLMVRAVKGHINDQELQVWTEFVKDKMPKLKAGDTVRITDRGQMTMSIPAQVSATEILLLDDEF